MEPQINKKNLIFQYYCGTLKIHAEIILSHFNFVLFPPGLELFCSKLGFRNFKFHCVIFQLAINFMLQVIRNSIKVSNLNCKLSELREEEGERVCVCFEI